MTFNVISAGDAGLSARAMENWRHVNYGNVLNPVNATGTAVNATIDLGASGTKFKDAYLSAALNFSTNTISDGQMSGNWAMNSGNITGLTTLFVGTVDVGNLPAVQAVAGSVSVDNLPTVQQVEGTVEVSNLGNAASETTILLDVDVVLDENTVGWTSPPFDVGAFRQVSIGINKSGSTPHCTIEWEWFDGGGFVGTDVFFGVATLPVRATRGRISCGIDNLNQVIVLHSAAIYA